MLERLGIADELAERRERFARYAYRAPQDRLARMKPSNPVPMVAPLVEPPSEPKAAHPTVDHVADEAAAITLETGRLLVRIENHPRPYLVRLNVEIIARVTHLQAVFCEAYNGLRPDGEPHAIIDLKRQSRAVEICQPRAACISLARLIWNVSYPNLGTLFGRLDHTSVMHALKKAPGYLRRDPILAAAHAAVLAHFKVQT
jgi:hypothetical protein